MKSRRSLLLLVASAVHVASALQLDASRGAVAARAPPRTRAPPPLLLANKKGKKQKGKKARGGASPQPPPPAAADMPIMAVPPPPANVPVPIATPPMATPPPADMAPLSQPPPPLSQPPPMDYGSPAAYDDDELPAFDEPLAYADEPKMKLPTFSEYNLGPAKAAPPADFAYKSKLPSINQGRPVYEAEAKEEKPLFEKIIFNLAWAGIAFLVFVEIFVNSPLFPEVKPAVLKLMGD